MISQLRGFLARKIKENLYQDEIDNLKLLAAKTLVRQNQALKNPTLAEVEFQAFSQFGDDGIIQHLIAKVKLKKSEFRFVEFGVEDYREANTRFLLLNNRWQGLVIEMDPQAVTQIWRQSLSWKYPLTAISGLITKKNIIRLITQAGFSADLGILSIDIDGNDYWIANEVLSVIRPIILIVEFNLLWGERLAVTIPYQPNFYRFKGHFSGTYWGASLGALQYMAKQYGYVYVGCNSVGLNAYFVRQDRLGKLKPDQTKVPKRTIRDSRDQNGQLDYLSLSACLRRISHLKLFNLKSGRLETIKGLFPQVHAEKKLS